jgi:hypothetical protein
MQGEKNSRRDPKKDHPHLNIITGRISFSQEMGSVSLIAIFIFLTAPQAAATQGLANQGSIPVMVHTNANASTSMVAVDNVTSWVQYEGR